MYLLYIHKYAKKLICNVLKIPIHVGGIPTFTQYSL